MCHPVSHPPVSSWTAAGATLWTMTVPVGVTARRAVGRASIVILGAAARARVAAVCVCSCDDTAKRTGQLSAKASEPALLSRLGQRCYVQWKPMVNFGRSDGCGTDESFGWDSSGTSGTSNVERCGDGRGPPWRGFRCEPRPWIRSGSKVHNLKNAQPWG